jgi:hypothetical protein
MKRYRKSRRSGAFVQVAENAHLQFIWIYNISAAIITSLAASQYSGDEILYCSVIGAKQSERSNISESLYIPYINSSEKPFGIGRLFFRNILKFELAYAIIDM